jgi:hypothetical protein
MPRELARRGLHAIDPDNDPELAYSQDAGGHRAERPQHPDEQWLRSHRWVWSRSRLEEVLASYNEPVFVCGIARNQAEPLDLFGRVFLLRIDGPTQEARLVAHDALHPPGRSEAGRQEIRDGRTVSSPRRSGTARSPSTAQRRQPWSLTNSSLSWQPPERTTAC